MSDQRFAQAAANGAPLLDLATMERARAAAEAHPDPAVRAILLAACTVETEPDTSARPPVVGWVDSGTLHLATPWKPSPEYFGDRSNPASYCGAVTSHRRARWGTIVVGGVAWGAWTMPADATATGVLALLRKGGFQVTQAKDAAAAVEALQAAVAAAPRRVKVKKGRGRTGGPSAPSAAPEASGFSFDSDTPTPSGG